MNKSILQDLLFIVVSTLILLLLVYITSAEVVGKFSFIPVYSAYLIGKYLMPSSKSSKK